jgi:hypothetical protein
MAASSSQGGVKVHLVIILTREDFLNHEGNGLSPKTLLTATTAFRSLLNVCLAFWALSNRGGAAFKKLQIEPVSIDIIATGSPEVCHRPVQRKHYPARPFFRTCASFGCPSINVE